MSTQPSPVLVPLPSVTVHDSGRGGLMYDFARFFQTINQIISGILWLPIIGVMQSKVSGYLLLAVWGG